MKQLTHRLCHPLIIKVSNYNIGAGKTQYERTQNAPDRNACVLCQLRHRQRCSKREIVRFFYGMEIAAWFDCCFTANGFQWPQMNTWRGCIGLRFNFDSGKWIEGNFYSVLSSGKQWWDRRDLYVVLITACELLF